MSSIDNSAEKFSDHAYRLSCRANRTGKCPWSGINIAAMVIAFILFWPLGLFILFWVLSGRRVQDLPDAARSQWTKMINGLSSGDGSRRTAHSDNEVFNDYQRTQFDRIQEIKEEIKQRARRFANFRADAKRRADEDEFNRFMNSASKHDD